MLLLCARPEIIKDNEVVSYPLPLLLALCGQLLSLHLVDPLLQRVDEQLLCPLKLRVLVRIACVPDFLDQL